MEARRHILAILQDYPSLRPPIDHLCELLPRLQARYYSIASSAKVGEAGQRTESIALASLRCMGALSMASDPNTWGSSLDSLGIALASLYPAGWL